MQILLMLNIYIYIYARNRSGHLPLHLSPFDVFFMVSFCIVSIFVFRSTLPEYDPNADLLGAKKQRRIHFQLISFRLKRFSYGPNHSSLRTSIKHLSKERPNDWKNFRPDGRAPNKSNYFFYVYQNKTFIKYLIK